MPQNSVQTGEDNLDEEIQVTTKSFFIIVVAEVLNLKSWNHGAMKTLRMRFCRILMSRYYWLMYQRLVEVIRMATIARPTRSPETQPGTFAGACQPRRWAVTPKDVHSTHNRKAWSWSLTTK